MTARMALAFLGLPAFVLAVGTVGCAGLSTGAEIEADGSLVVVQVPQGALTGTRGGLVDPETRFPEGSRVVLVGPHGSTVAPRVLSEGLRAAGAPSLSPDGKRVLFAARPEGAATWAIYEARLARGRPRVVIGRDEDCTDPAWLAGERIVASCRDAGPQGEPRWSLYTADSKGSGLQRITFGPGDAFSPTALADGRILFSMRQRGGRGRSGSGTVALFTVNPDGTLLDAFAGSHQTASKFGARQVGLKSVVFLEQSASPVPRRGLPGVVGDFPGSPGAGPRLSRVDFQHPRRGETVLLPASGATGEAPHVAAVEPMPGGGFLVALRENNAGFSVHRLAPDGSVMERVFDEPGWEEVAALPVARREPPRGRPSAIDLAAATGTVVCYDSARSDHVVGPSRDAAAPARVEVLAATDSGRQRTLGEIPVAADGSFFAEVPADTPLRIVTRTDDGSTIAASDWFWVRPGEKRACFGCHESRDSAPVNRAVAALANDAVRLLGEAGAMP